jgi:peptide/nickel transport system permease protein
LLALQYFLKRIGISIVVFFGVSIVIFCLARLIPGDPARIALGPFATKEMVEQLRETLHLNESIVIQYKIFIINLFHGDLGISTYTKRPVLDDIIAYFPATFELVLMSGTLMLLIGMPLGILSGAYKDTIIDHISRIISLLGVVTPSFLWAIILMLLFSYLMPIFPVSERLNETLDPPKLITGLLLIDSLIDGSFKVFGDALYHLVLPGLAVAMPAIGNVSRLTRTNLSDAYNKQYIEFAKSYAFSDFKIATKYALKPASIPTVTIIGLDFAFMLGNAFLVETVFVWPGMAKYGVEVILAKDLNGIIATALVLTTFFLIINMVVDFVVLFLNPRISLRD